MTRLTLAYLLLSLITLSAFADSGGVGNGGDAVICPDSTTLLDSYEARKLGFKIDLHNPKIKIQTRRSMVMVAVDRLFKKDKYTSKKLYEYSMELVADLEEYEAFHKGEDTFKGKVLYLSPDVVGEIDDSEHRTLPGNCEVRQLVSQINPTRRYENRYEMNKILWDKLSLVDQAMTILHEAWYRIMLEDGARDSRGARYMNALVASTRFEKDSFAHYLDDLRTTEKRFYIVENHSTLIFDKVFRVDLKKLNLSMEGTRVCTDSLQVRANIKKVAFITNMHLGLAGIRFTNVCFRNSVLESLTLPRSFSNKRINFVMENYLVRTDGLNGPAGVLKFNANGTFQRIENLEIEALYKMFYSCRRNGKKYQTFIKGRGCSGPYLHYDSEVKNPRNVIFDSREIPIGFNFPNKV